MEWAKKKLKCNSLKYKNLNNAIYQIEVPNKAKAKIPDDWVLEGHTAQLKRYYSPALTKMISAYEELLDRKEEIQRNILQEVFRDFDQYYPLWKQAIKCIAGSSFSFTFLKFVELDCLMSLAFTSGRSHLKMCRPQFDHNPNAKPYLELRNMVHPFVVPTFQDHVIPNDTVIGGDKPNTVIVTG